MGVDTDLATIVRDIVQFLDSLGDIELPPEIENTRENLVQRTKSKLATLTTSRGSTSPEPYLDMNAGKGLLQTRINKSKHIEIEEYVGVEDQSTGALFSHQDYYESFNVEDKLLDIYRTFTRVETVGKARKFGNLDKKIERRSFGLSRDIIRSCWIGLVGTHLIVYENNDDRQPPEICSIRGYKARAAPSAVPKNPERAQSAFEIFCPGNKTLQFIAGTPKEMEEWVDAIGGTSNKIHEEDILNNEDTIENKRSDDPLTNRALEISVPLRTTTRPDNSNGIKANVSSCEKKNNSIVSSVQHSPPILPIRVLPRRLPSLPNEQIVNQPSYEPMDDGYEEDDIYHKIEDIRYENVKDTSNNGVCQQGRVKKPSKRKKNRKPSSPGQVIETYDDIQWITRDNQMPLSRDVGKSLEDQASRENDTFLTYDDVVQTCPPICVDVPSVVEYSESKIERSPIKCSHKRWFLLDRVRHRKDSAKNEEKTRVEERKNREKLDRKKEQSKLHSTESASGELNFLANYDDVSEYVNRQTKIDHLSVYNCPPPPRPICVESAHRINVSKIINNVEVQQRVVVDQVYDDISNYRDNGIEESEEGEESGHTDYKNTLSLRMSKRFEQDNNIKIVGGVQLLTDSEHYQTPRKNGHHLNQRTVPSHCQDEQQLLYDDIATLADFGTRHREPAISAEDKLTISIKKLWNLFGSGKKNATRHAPLVETATKNI